MAKFVSGNLWRTRPLRIAWAAFAALSLGASVWTGCSTPRDRIAEAGRPDLKISKDHAQMVITSQELGQHLRPVTVSVADPVYAKRKTYVGYRFTDVLKLAGISLDPEDVVIFSALDGYQARANSSQFQQQRNEAIIAIKDADFPSRWEPLIQGKDTISPGPYYLIWQTREGDGSAAQLPWPYQLAEIRVRPREESRDKILPKAVADDVAAKRGFDLFERNCLSCHSINLEGGVLGPELNVPRNVTEYRDAKLLKEFISDPSSFRARSKMPSFEKTLLPRDLEDILAYLAAMAKHKLPAHAADPRQE